VAAIRKGFVQVCDGHSAWSMNWHAMHPNVVEDGGVRVR